jgi:Fe-S-cluster containining protein
MNKKYKAPCNLCGGKCCEYIAIEIDKPKNKKDYDVIRWYLSHKNVNVFIDHDNKWYVEFRTPCEFQKPNKKCGIYANRPDICRRHGVSHGDCEYYDLPYRMIFRNTKEFEDHLDQKTIDWRFIYND